jgi:phosphate-selective porin OprO/OprP
MSALVCALIATTAHGQNDAGGRTTVEVKNGIVIRKDSLFLLNLRFRMQNRFGVITEGGDDLDVGVTDMRVRRMRLRFEGFVLDERVKYYVQLNFSHSDLDLDAGGVAKPIRDAIVQYQVHERFQFGLGQTKVPGNRQRMISSGNLQFPDRSIANGAFTLDRDFGVFANWTLPIGPQLVRTKVALTTGDGRSAVPGNSGLAYTGRLEWAPFGAFTNDGEFSEGDLEFEATPKLAFGGAVSHNDRAYRTGGQLGPELHANRSFTTFIADAVLKYDGWAFSAEYLERQCADPITTNTVGDVRFVPTGQAFNVQLSKLLRSGYELATRYTVVEPATNTDMLSPRTEEALLGATKYLNGHRIKLQSYIGYRWTDGRMRLGSSGNNWTAMLQVEFGI